MSKPFIKQFNSFFLLLLLLVTANVSALESDKQADFELTTDNFKNIPAAKNGQTLVKCWGNVTIEQGTLKITANEAIIYRDKGVITKIILTGKQVNMQQIIDAEYGKIKVAADKIEYMLIDKLLLMTGNVLIESKIQGAMSGEKITMDLKTKEIKGENSGRVKLIIKPNK